VKGASEYLDTTNSSRRYVRRDHNDTLERLMADYFDEDSVYDDDDFRGTFHLPKRLFLEIVQRIEATVVRFFKRAMMDGVKKSFTALQKCLSALQQLADGNPTVQIDKYFKMACRTLRECPQHFCDAICHLYQREYLRRPTAHDVAILQVAHEELHHIPGMLGSIDCTHFE
jgi:hypothetical protein